MFFHGINYDYLLSQYPLLSPGLVASKLNQKQKEDREHLIEQYGFEPVHLLKSSTLFNIRDCIRTCFKYGNLILMYDTLEMPSLQLSENEYGVKTIDVRQAKLILINQPKLVYKIKEKMKEKSIFLITNQSFSKGILIK